MPPTDALTRTLLSIVGILLSPAFLWFLWKGALFFAKAITKLDQIDEIADAVKDLRDAQSTDGFAVSLSLAVIENDINALQEKLELPVRQYPDRRTGLPDRRRA